MGKRYAFGILIFASTFFSPAVFGDLDADHGGTIRYYLEQEGDRAVPVVWTLHHRAGYELIYAKGSEIQTTRTNEEPRPVDAIKVELRAAGWRAPFWHSHYWYRAADGAFVRFEGPANASGTIRILITLTGEQTTHR